MVHELQLRNRRRSEALRILRAPATALILALSVAVGGIARADGPGMGTDYLRDSRALYKNAQYFTSARYAFAAMQWNPALKADAYSWITLSLVHARLYNAASYFFIKTLQTASASRNHAALKRVLGETEALLVRDGADLFRNYLIRHTRYEDYDSVNLSAYLYSLGKEALLAGDEQRSIGYLNSIRSQSPLWPFALQLRGSAYAILGKTDQAIRDFDACAARAGRTIAYDDDHAWRKRQRREADDLQARCLAGKARTLYQANRFEQADRAYDAIAKKSFVWPDILFEQAWNSFAMREYNRSLGKLVSYKSPALEFVFNPEVDVLRAQSYLALCLYSDANVAINDFNSKYTRVGVEVKQFVESHANNLGAFYDAGKQALRSPLYTRNEFYKMENRFVRGPYFQNLVSAERSLVGERGMVRQFAMAREGGYREGEGFPGFLNEVLRWRLRSIRALGGAFVKNSLIDYHRDLIANFEKMAFIKAEMLRMAKEKLIYKHSVVQDRSRGNVEPTRRDDQYYWSFNGEFWNDELGDYVFGLESECGKS